MEGFGCNHNVNQSVVAEGDEGKSTFLLKPPNKNLTQFLFMGPGSSPSFIFITFGGRETPTMTVQLRRLWLAICMQMPG